MKTRSQIVLGSALKVLRPLVRLLLRNGVAYPAFAAALKAVFLQAAQDELAARRMPATDSALTLMSGVHRRDLRRLGRQRVGADEIDTAPLSLAAEVVGRWMSDPAFLGADGQPRELPRSGVSSFDDLVHGVSRDVRPRAVLDEMLRLGVAREGDGGIVLEGDGLAPRQGFEELGALFTANLHDHLSAAAANLQGDANFLEQAVFVDQITAESALALQRASTQAWREALRTVMLEARERFDQDAARAPVGQRTHRARFGVYFFSDREAPQ